MKIVCAYSRLFLREIMCVQGEKSGAPCQSGSQPPPGHLSHAHLDGAQSEGTIQHLKMPKLGKKPCARTQGEN